MKKLYIVISSCDKWEDHYKVNECVCSSLFFAENKKTELENKYREEIPFPFDYCTEKEFDDLFRQDKVINGEAVIYLDWLDQKENQEVFNCCFINEIDYYE